MAYTVQLDNYQGPLDLLLQLIERNQLDVCEVSLAQVTNNYIAHIERLSLPLDERNWFADIASRLVLVKSRALLPDLQTAGEQDDKDDDLTEQLELYRLYRNASRQLQKLTKTPSYVRRLATPTNLANLTYKNLSSLQLQAAFEQVATQLKHKQRVEKSFAPRRGSFQKLRAQALAKLGELDRLQLSKLTDLATDQFELIIYFLCILELVRNGDFLLKSGKNGAIMERVDG